MPRRDEYAVATLSWLAFIILSWLALARYHSFHNETFDLAFYTRMAWGLVRGSFWDPILSAHVGGLHWSPVLILFGALGALTSGTARWLLLAQSFCFAASVFPIARLGERALGRVGSLLGPVLFLLHPTVSHVASYEFHPASLAVLPMAWLIEALASGNRRRFLLAALGVLACREDLALFTILAAALFYRTEATDQHSRYCAGAVAGGSLIWFALFALVAHPRWAPPGGSMELHFGRFGATVPEAAWFVLSHPLQVAGEILTWTKLSYLISLVAIHGGLALVRPRLLCLLLPTLVVNLLSAWPTAADWTSHYTMAAVPITVAAALEGAAVLREAVGARLLAAGLFLMSLLFHIADGQSPLSATFDAGAFHDDAKSVAAHAVLAAIPGDASVQAPYALMPHLAERMRVTRPPPPDRDCAFVVLDTSHRARFIGDESVLRTVEEPTVRDWLAKPDVFLRLAEGPYVLLERQRPSRPNPLFRRYFRSQSERWNIHTPPLPLTQCLTLVGARFLGPAASADVHGAHQGRPVEGGRLSLALTATAPCPADLALRLGTHWRPERTELLFDGLLNPAQLAPGDTLWSHHRLTRAHEAALHAGKLRAGLVRQSGARPEKTDPVGVRIPTPTP